MIKEKNIKKLERRLKKVEKQLDKLQGKEASPNYLNNYRLKISDLNNEINRLCCINLEISNPDFKRIANENYRCVQSHDIVLKTYKEEMSYMGSYANTLNGKLKNNGHIYCNTQTTNNWIFNPFARYLFPAEFTGTMDSLGNIRLKASKIDAAFINRLPSEFIGEIDSKGKMKLKTSKTEGDFITQGKILVSKIVGEYLFESDAKANQFYSNKQELLNRIKDYRKAIQ